MNKYLNFCVFYNREEWQYLLKLCIRPLIEEYVGGYGSCLLYISIARGEHIFLSIKSDSESMVIFQKITQFIRLHPSLPPPEQNKDSKLFMDFPNNSIIHYALHPEIHLPQIDSEMKLHEAITHLMLIDVDDFSAEAMFELVIQMHGGLFRALDDHIENARLILKNLRAEEKINKWQTIASEKAKIVLNYLNDNRTTLSDFFESLWNKDDYLISKAFQQWIVACRGYLSGNLNGTALSYIYATIYQHTGMEMLDVNSCITDCLVSCFAF
jgi:hypothetical protein